MKRERIPEVHFYEWRVNAWVTSPTRTNLDAAGRGIYRDLLDLCYTQGSISTDHNTLARYCNATVEEFDRTWKLISRHFRAHKKNAGLMVNKQAELYRNEYFKYIDKQRNSGGSGGRKKRGRVTQDESTTYEPSASKARKHPLEKAEANTIQDYGNTTAIQDDGEKKTPPPPTPTAICDESVRALEYRIDSIRQMLYDFRQKIPDDGMVLGVESALRGATLEELRDFLLDQDASRFQGKTWGYFKSVVESHFGSVGRKRVITSANEVTPGASEDHTPLQGVR